MRAFTIAAFVALVGACGGRSVGAPGGSEDVALPDHIPVTNAAEAGAPADIDSGGADELAFNVSLTGSGMGTVGSTPGGLTCVGTTCKGSFARGATVTMVAAPAAGSLFAGWKGECTGTASCVAVVDRDIAAIAEFQSIEGTWTGTYTNTRMGAAGCIFNNAGNLSVSIKANGATFTSGATLSGLQVRGIPSCDFQGVTGGTAPDSVLTIAADTLTGTWTANVFGVGGTLAFPFTAKVSGKKITGTWTCPTCTGSFTVTKP